MIGAHHDTAGHTRNAILCFHPLTRFFIATDKIAQFNACFPQCLLASEYRALDIKMVNTRSG